VGECSILGYSWKDIQRFVETFSIHTIILT
jgi:hypothetical protein